MPSLVEKLLDVTPDHLDDPALVQTGDIQYTLTYDQLGKCVAGLEFRMRKLGLKEGSVCCISMANSPCFVAVVLAVLKMGAMVAPLNPALKKDEFLFALEDLDADLLVGSEGFHQPSTDLAQASDSHTCGLAECYWDGECVLLHVIRERNSLSEKQNTSDDLVALGLHTSGTTGTPKAVPLLQSNLLASAKNVQDAYHLTREDRSILIMPLFHIHGIVAGLLAPLLCGSCIIIPGKGLRHTFWDDFVTYKATWWTATPTHQAIILSFPMPPQGTIPRFIRSCSSPLAPSLLQQLEKAFKAPVLEAYAMTENAHHIASNTEKGPRKVGSVGLPCPGISLKIVDQDEKAVASDEKGEIVIKGPSVMHGYRDNPQADKKAFTRDGFFRTGDQGMLDEDGHLHLTDRLKEMINKGGEKVAPNEVDNVLLQHEDIREAVTFGIPDDISERMSALRSYRNMAKNLSRRQ